MEPIPDQSEYDIRYSNQEDLPYLHKWIKNPMVRRWYLPSTDKDYDIMLRNWIGFSKYAASLTAIYKKEPVGIVTLFLMPYLKLIHHCMLYFIVDPNFSRRSIGGSLLRNGAHLAKNYFHFEKMHIEVYEGCPAIPLLIREGYKEIFRQEHFIKEGDGNYLARILYEITLIPDNKASEDKESTNGK